MPYSPSDTIDILLRARSEGRDQIQGLNADTKALIATLQTNTKSLDTLTASINKMGEAAKKNFKQSGEALDDFSKRLNAIISNPASSVNSPFSMLGRAAQQFAQTLGPVGIALSATGVGIAALGAGAIALVSEMAQASRELLNFSLRLGLSVDQAQRLSIQAKLAGVNISTLEQSARTLGNALADPQGSGKKQAEALQNIGISAHTATGGERELGEVVMEVIGSLSKMTDAAERAHYGQVLLGRSSKELIPLIAQYDETKQAADRFADGLDANANSQLIKAKRAVSELDTAWELLKKNLVAEISPVVIPIIAAVTAVISPPNDSGNATDAQRRQYQTHWGPGGPPSAAAQRALDNANRLSDLLEFADRSADKKRWDAKHASTKEGLEEDIKIQKEAMAKAKAIIDDLGVGTVAREKAKSDYEKASETEKRDQAALKYPEQLKQAQERNQRFITKMESKGEDPIGRIFIELNENIKQNGKLVDQATAKTAAFKAMFMEAQKEGDKFWKTLNSATQKVAEWNIENSKRQVKEFHAGLEKASAADEKDISILMRDYKETAGTEIDNKKLQSRYAQQLQEIGGGKKDNINAAYTERLQLAKEILDINLRTIAVEQGIADTMTEAAMSEADQAKAQDAQDSVKVERAKTIREYNKETDEAQFDRWAKFHEYQQKQLDEYKKAAGEVFDALVAKGSTGLRDFFSGQLKTVERQLFVNVAGELMKGGGGLGLDKIIGGQTDATGKSTLIGRLLQGTPLESKAIDYAKQTAANTAQIAAQMTGTGFGGASPIGGMSSTASTFASLASPGFSAAMDGGMSSAASTFASIPGFSAAMASAKKGNFLSGFFTGVGGLAHGANVFKALGGKDDYSVQQGPGKAQSASSLGFTSAAGRAGIIIGAGGAVLAGVEGAIGGFSKGGGRGISQGIGSIAGTAAALDPEPISKSILAGVALAAGVVSSLFGDPRAERQEQINKYIQSHQNALPSSIARDFDISGSEVYGQSTGKVRAGAQTNINVNISTMDSKSFIDNSRQISDAVYHQMILGHHVMEPVRAEFAK